MRNLRSLYLNDLEVIRILCNIVDSSCKAYSIFKLDKFICFKKEKCSCLVSCIIRNSDCISVSDLIKALLGSTIDSKWLIVDPACIYK